jgi:hypothetical protein
MSTIPPLPAGYKLDEQSDIPPLPAGYKLDQPAPPPRSWLDSAKDFASEAWNQVNPVAAVKGLAQAANHPIDTGKQLLISQAEVEKKAEESFKKGDYGTGVRHVLNYLIPVLGPQIDRAGDLMQSGEYAKGAGATVGIGANVAVPAIIKGGINMVKPAASRALLLGKTPAEAYQSALKPSTTLSEAQRTAIVNTGLREKIPVSAKGLEDLSDLIQDINSKMDSAIPANSTQTVSKAEVASRLGPVAQQFAAQVNPESDLNAINESGKEFLRNQPANIPVQDAAALKTGTYRSLGNKAYGELKGAQIESQKALARGIKEELITQFPELEQLGIRDQQLLNLQPVLERAVNRIGNHQLIGIGTPVTTGAAKALTGSNTLAGVAGVLKAVLDNPMVKSRLAIALSKSGLPYQTAVQRVNGYQNALASAALTAAHESSDQSPDQ